MTTTRKTLSALAIATVALSTAILGDTSTASAIPSFGHFGEHSRYGDPMYSRWHGHQYRYGYLGHWGSWRPYRYWGYWNPFRYWGDWHPYRYYAFGYAPSCAYEYKAIYVPGVGTERVPYKICK